MSGGWGSRAKGTTAGPVRSSGGWGSRANTPAPVKKPGGGGHGIFHALGDAAHAVASTAELTAHDLKSIPGGTADLVNTGAVQPWWNLVTTGHPYAHGAGRKIDERVNALSDSTAQTIAHPLRDPFQTLLLLAPALHGVGKAGAAVKAGDASVLFKRYEPPPRLIGPAKVPLHASRNPFVRAVQGGYDRLIRRALRDNPEGRLAAHAERRVGASLAETGRYQARMREAPAATLEHAGRKLGTRAVPRKLQEAALRLASENSTAEEAARYHHAQAAKGIAATENARLARLYERVHELGLLTADHEGHVVVDGDRYPRLAAADAQVARGQAEVDKIIARHGEMSEEQLAARRNGPARIRAGARYEKPTPGKLGIPSAALKREQARTASLARRYQDTLDKEARYRADLNGKQAGLHAAPSRVLAPMSEEQARARLGELDKQHEALLQKIAPEVNPYSAADVKRETAARNAVRGKVRKGRAQEGRGAPPAKLKTVSQEVRDLAESKLLDTLDKNKGNPVADRARALVEERQQLRDLLNQRSEAAFGGEKPPALPKVEQPVKPANGGELVPQVPEPSNPYRNRLVRLALALEEQQGRLARTEKSANGRVKPTGIVGGETARPGRGYVSYRAVEPKAARSAQAASGGPVVGKARSFVTKTPFTGHGLEHGQVPDNTTGLVARHMRRAYRYVNTDQFRRAVLQTGHDVRRSSRDVLVRLPDEKAGKIPAEIEAALGRKTLTTDELAGHEAAYHDFVQRLIPGVRDSFATDKAQAIGAEAPDGYRWVDRGALGDLARPAAGSAGRIARAADSVNAAVTAATVYFKIGHVGTRVLTNAATNIIQGSAQPLEVARSLHLWKGLSFEERRAALGAAGQHGFEAMPHEGQSIAGRVASKGANWWAKHADAPFRFNSLAYEARKAGYRTPVEFRSLLRNLKDPSRLSPEERARVDSVAKRANRQGIAYDRLNELERRYITRGVWFYPWVKGATVFAAHTLTEHPYKSAALGQAGLHGRARQQHQLGSLPSYEQGLFQVGGSHDRPLVTDFSTFSPFATPASVLDAAGRPGQTAGFLNPVYGALSALSHGLNQYGQPSKSPVTDALSALTAPTPEAQILAAYLHRHQDQSQRMFHTTWESALLRSLIGPATPRHVNPRAAHKAYGREQSGR